MALSAHLSTHVHEFAHALTGNSACQKDPRASQGVSWEWSSGRVKECVAWSQASPTGENYLGFKNRGDDLD